MHLMGMEHTVQDFNNKHIVSKANNLELPKHSIKHIDGECKLCSVTNIAMEYEHAKVPKHLPQTQGERHSHKSHR